MSKYPKLIHGPCGQEGMAMTGREVSLEAARKLIGQIENIGVVVDGRFGDDADALIIDFESKCICIGVARGDQELPSRMFYVVNDGVLTCFVQHPETPTPVRLRG